MSNVHIEEQAASYLRERLRVMENRYVSAYPKWTVTDYVQVSLLLTERDGLIRELNKQKKET